MAVVAIVNIMLILSVHILIYIVGVAVVIAILFTMLVVIGVMMVMTSSCEDGCVATTPIVIKTSAGKIAKDYSI